MSQHTAKQSAHGKTSGVEKRCRHSKIKLICNLKPARPRDKGEIESMFNAGRGRIYLQPEVEGAVDLDNILDVSAYGNKDRKNITSGFAEKLSNFGHG